MYLFLIQLKTSIQALSSSLLDGDWLSLSPVFRPMLKTNNPRPGLAMQAIPSSSPASQLASRIQAFNAAKYADVANR